MRKRAVLSVILALALAACNGSKKETEPESGNTPLPSPAAASTEQAETGADYSTLEPGLHMQSGLTMIRYNSGALNGTGYFYGEVRNDTGALLARAESTVYPLDTGGFRLATVDASPLLTDLAPGLVFYVGREFTADENFADSSLWVRYNAGDDPSLEGFFGLPVTVDSHGVGDGVAYVAHGTAQNTSGKDLMFPVIDIVLIGPDDNLVGLGHGLVTDGLTDNVWAAGGTVTFEASFGFIAAAPEQITGVVATAAGYATG
jgi:hypothetical protein